MKTEQFGVPQTRTRAVLVARLPGLGGIEPLEATHQPFDLLRGKRNATQAAMFPTVSAIPGAKQPWISMAEALDAASKLKDSPVDVSRLRAGGKVKFFIVSNYGSGGDPKNRGRRRLSEPAFTVTGKISRNKVYKSLAEYDADQFDRFTIPEAGVLKLSRTTFRGPETTRPSRSAMPYLRDWA